MTKTDELPTYDGDDLGVSYSPEKSVFKVWSPKAQEMRLKIYDAGNGGSVTKEFLMAKSNNGVWSKTVEEDLKGKYYTLQATVDNKLLHEVPDIYAKAVGVNGKRAMILDLSETDPEGWEADERPPLASFNDIIIYELHVRDLSIHSTSGIENKGKFLAFTEENTASPEGVSTGVQHLKDLGITHLHLLPSFDYNSVDESKLDQPQFNWGYDPLNYNVPEGSYSSDPFNGSTRIKEFKQMVYALHKNGIRVVMDVVYNHTALTETSYFNQLAPNYYYRLRQDGTFSDASACGNETASDQEMMRKYIVESVVYWAKEFHIDGFRFDLMGIHDLETMEAVTDALEKIDPTIFVYGEGWTASDSPLPDSLRALKRNTYQLSKVAAFNDDLRDGIKGHWSNHEETGFVAGKEGLEESVKFGIVGATNHPQINYDLVNYSDQPWAREPWQSINYVSCHDDFTLWDKLEFSTKADEKQLIRMHQLANTIVLTSQGIPFLHAGVDFLRTKGGDHNSYRSSDSVNALKWDQKKKYLDVHNYYRQLVNLRKAHPVFRLGSNDLLKQSLTFHESPKGTVAYGVETENGDQGWESVFLIFNGNTDPVSMKIPEADWKVVLRDGQFSDDNQTITGSQELVVEGVSALILRK